MESIAVRNAERVETSIPALARNTLQPDEKLNWQPVVIKDLSSTGVRLESMKSLGNEGEAIQLRFTLEVCESEEDLDLTADIRNVSHHHHSGKHGYSTGAQFQNLDRFYKVVLHDHVLDQKLKHI
jgi:hypothetical protein